MTQHHLHVVEMLFFSYRLPKHVLPIWRRNSESPKSGLTSERGRKKTDLPRTAIASREREGERSTYVKQLIQEEKGGRRSKRNDASKVARCELCHNHFVYEWLVDTKFFNNNALIARFFLDITRTF